MRIRCGRCHRTIRVPEAGGSTDRPRVHCDGCSQEYDLGSTFGRIDLDEFHRDAREFASNGKIDLPAAYSVLLGITTLEAMQELCGPDPAAPAAEAQESDPPFEDSLETGRQTPQQIASRRTYQAVAPHLTEDPRRTPVPRIVVASSAAILVLAALGAWLGASGVDKDTDVPASSRDSDRVIASLKDVETEVRHNDEGELSEVSGGDPEAVLNAFCRAKTGRKSDPVGLESAGDDWTGLYRENGELFGIAIRRDPDRRAWIVGNAVDRIRPQPLDNPPAEAP